MPSNVYDFDLGHQNRVVIVGPFGEIQLPMTTDFDANPIIDKARVKRLSGIPVEKHVPAGWEGKITFARKGPGADDFWSLVSSQWWANGTLNGATIFQYINEGDGGQTTYQFVGCAISLSKAGSWKASSEVEQSIDFFAGDRIKVA